eukprot:NODE_941_length_2990_cov_0.295745.p4 type:complete len:109 gc:universal NODE_941_length_2990_cov_0.295745:1171-845(-)
MGLPSSQTSKNNSVTPSKISNWNFSFQSAFLPALSLVVVFNFFPPQVKTTYGSVLSVILDFKFFASITMTSKVPWTIFPETGRASVYIEKTSARGFCRPIKYIYLSGF